jgi:5-(carboxyamino)imidazole ribonucleotide synthase
VTSQFEQQVRAICGLVARRLDADQAGCDGATCSAICGSTASPDWAAALAVPDVKLHLYG